MKKALKFLGNFALAAVIGFSMVSCPVPEDDSGNNQQFVNHGEVQVVAMNISEVEIDGVKSEWDWIAVVDNEVRSTMLFNVDEETGKIPTRLFYKPDKDLDVGFTFLCRENGLPDTMEFNGYLLYFDNFDGYTFDLAVIYPDETYPDETVEYHYGIEYDIDFDAWDARFTSEGGRSVYSGGRSIIDALNGGFSTDPVAAALDVVGYLVDLGTCVASIFLPPLLVGCVIGAISQVLEIGLSVLNYFVKDTDFIGEMGSLTISGVNLMIDALGCTKAIMGKFWDYNGWLDCGAAFITLSSVLVGTVQDLFEYFSSSGKKAAVKEEMKPVMGKAKVNFYANGGSGKAPAAQTVETAGGYGEVTLPSVAGLSRTGYYTYGWNTSPKANVYYPAGASQMVKGNTSFYAVWIQGLPDAPTGVTAVTVSSSSIKVSWDQFSGAALYYVYRSTSASGNYAKVGTVGIGATTPATSYTDTGLSANTVYYYKVSAWSSGAKGESGQSAAVSARTQAGSSGGGTAPAITTASLPNGTVGTAYSQTLTATGSAPITWSIESGALPAGLTLTAGVIAGNPTTAGTSNFTVKAANAAGSGTRALAIVITASAAHVHDWGDWGTPTTATETTDGVRTRVCKNNASHTETEIVEYATGTAGLSYYETTDISTGIPCYRVSTGTETGDIFIPEYWRPNANSPYLPVTEIGRFWNNTSITSVHIPATVTTIWGDSRGGFRGCTNLASVTFAPNSQLTYIDGGQFSSSGPFRDCTSLTSITIPASVKLIGGQNDNFNDSWGGTFLGCTSLASVTFEEGSQLEFIAGQTFRGCTSLTGITIPASVKRIGIDAFQDCTGLTSTSVTFAAGSQLQTISGFNGCTGLTGTLTIPASVTTIRGAAFQGCTGLTSITIPASVTTIGQSVFQDCTGLTSVTFEAGSQLTAIPYNTQTDGVFLGCTSLTSITFAGSSQLTTIGGNNTSIYNPFSNLTSLTSITLPEGLTTIGIGAFFGCTGLTDITIPNSVTTIGSGAFLQCTGLIGITIPNSVTTISGSAFLQCTGLASVTFKGTIPSDSFNTTAPFPGDLRAKFYATDSTHGTPGTYIVTSGTGDNKVWTKQ